jgi:hypothetical protein
MADLAAGRRFALHEANVDAVTVRGRERRPLEPSPSFVAMRRLAMRLRGLLRGADPTSLTASFMTQAIRTTLNAAVRENADARHRSHEYQRSSFGPAQTAMYGSGVRRWRLGPEGSLPFNMVP